jgi:hypothetical protein
LGELWLDGADAGHYSPLRFASVAFMAATLANGGVHPVSGQRAVRPEFISSILSVMTTCGIYDFTGEWVYRVGLPAKSGVGGGIVAVLPGQLGIGVYSPALDERGNSVRGIKVCDALSRSLDLHLFNTPAVSRSVLRLRFSGAQVSSSRLRPAEEVRRVSPQVRDLPAGPTAGRATVRLANGDVISGLLDGGDGETVRLTPWYAGPLAISRGQVVRERHFFQPLGFGENVREPADYVVGFVLCEFDRARHRSSPWPVAFPAGL